MNIPKQSGGDHGNQYTGGKNRDESNFGKTKAETISEMGYSKDQASDYQRMAQNQAVVNLVLEQADSSQKSDKAKMGGNFTFTEPENLPPRRQRQTFRRFLRST